MGGIPRDDDGQPPLSGPAKVAEGPIPLIAFDLDRLIVAGAENLRLLPAEREQERNRRELHSAVAPLAHERFEQRGALVRDFQTAGKLRHLGLAAGVIDRPAIVRIDEAEVPQFAALINVRHAWRRQFTDHLG